MHEREHLAADGSLAEIHSFRINANKRPIGFDPCVQDGHEGLGISSNTAPIAMLVKAPAMAPKNAAPVIAVAAIVVDTQAPAATAMTEVGMPSSSFQPGPGLRLDS
jgi:hypothetical protein